MSATSSAPGSRRASDPSGMTSSGATSLRRKQAKSFVLEQTGNATQQVIVTAAIEPDHLRYDPQGPRYLALLSRDWAAPGIR